MICLIDEDFCFYIKLIWLIRNCGEFDENFMMLLGIYANL